MARRSKKSTTKQIEEEVKREVRQAKKSIHQLMAEMQQSDIGSATPRQIQSLRQMLKKHQERGINIGYLKTVLFPEQFSYEIPLPLSSISYCKFTDKQEAIISTGQLGQGMLVWFPRVNGGPALFYFTADGGTTFTQNTRQRYSKAMPTSSQNAIALNSAYQYTSSGSIKPYRAYWKVGFSQYSSANFTQTALIGATISMQYVGKVESESGLWVGGHVYGVGVDNLCQDDIECSQWVTRGRPGEGLRFVFLPKDQTDYEFYPANEGYAMAQGGAPSSTQGNQNVLLKSVEKDTPDSSITTEDYPETAPMHLLLDGTIWSGASDPGSFNTTKFTTVSMQDLPDRYVHLIKEFEAKEEQKMMQQQKDKRVGAPSTPVSGGIQYIKNTNYIAMYWTGMEPNKDWIRIDSIRKFAGIPTQKTRDIVDLSRPSKSYDQNKTFAVLNMLCNNSPVGGHTLKEVDRVIDSLMDVIPNAGYYLDQGGIEPVTSLSDLVEALQDPTGTIDKNLGGPLTGQGKRMYKYFL